MNMEIRTFSNTIGQKIIEVSTVTHAGEPWFRGTDVAWALGYKNLGKTIRDHVDDDDKQRLGNWKGSNLDPIQDWHEGTQIYMNESGLYCLIFKSTKEEAKLFKRWVT